MPYLSMFSQNIKNIFGLAYKIIINIWLNRHCFKGTLNLGGGTFTLHIAISTIQIQAVKNEMYYINHLILCVISTTCRKGDQNCPVELFYFINSYYQIYFVIYM